MYCISVTSKCGSIIRENGSYFVNDNYPDFYDKVGSCQVTILKINPSVCQYRYSTSIVTQSNSNPLKIINYYCRVLYRLDFEVMNIMGPETLNHVCINDQFIVSGGHPTVPPICGRNDGNHGKLLITSNLTFLEL